MAEDIAEQVAEQIEQIGADTGEQAPAVAEKTEETPQVEPEQTEEEQSIPYERFKAVNEAKKAAEARVKEFEKAQQDADIAAKKEAGKWQELYEAKESELAQQRIANEELRLNSLRKEVAQKHGHVYLADRLRGETEEELESDLQSLIAKMPAPQAPSVNGAAGSGDRAGGSGGELYTEAELRELSARLGIPVAHLPKEKPIIN